VTVRVTQEPPADWDDRVRAFPGRTLYHTPAWMRAITAAYPGYRPRYLVEESGGVILPYVMFSKKGLKQILSLPFGTFGGPIYSSQTVDNALRAVLQTFKRQARGPAVLRYQIAAVCPEERLERLMEAVFGAPRIQRLSTYIVPLDRGFDWIWNTGYENDVRRCVRKAEKSGVTLHEETTPQGIQVLFDLYREQTKSWRVKAHTAEALWRVAESLGDRARVWVTRRQGVPLTAVLTLYDPEREVRPWVSGAGPESRQFKAYHFMMNGIMNDACLNGFKLWDWGGSVGRGSVEFFKRSMAGRPIPVVQVFREAAWYHLLRKTASQSRGSRA